MNKDLKYRFKKIISEVQNTALSCGRDPKTVKVVAVSKTKPVKMINKALEAGAEIFGENYIQEARQKIESLGSYPVPISWHFIGSLQRNKAKYAVKLFDLIHSVDSIKLARELNKEAAKINKVQNILIQVNISGEDSKSGISPENCISFIRQISDMENLSVRGLMTMPPFFDNPEKARPYFSQARELREAIEKENISNVSIDELSMGMTGDFKAAIMEGATLVRIGTAIFGERG